ncbi:hypothetical protein WICPIJ_006242 [Wickerhamomyces pijperi]|uniref:Uncharacterized protein n=1 Tax=Wickerhamomyces pijperi TaxID=599730 RepID=A0A9P8Q219_WICPI|nr:hypothetical protein WICPIJ_006242 [Wickerhamomyces pijperi]
MKVDTFYSSAPIPVTASLDRKLTEEVFIQRQKDLELFRKRERRRAVKEQLEEEGTIDDDYVEAPKKPKRLIRVVKPKIPDSVKETVKERKERPKRVTTLQQLIQLNVEQPTIIETTSAPKKTKKKTSTTPTNAGDEPESTTPTKTTAKRGRKPKSASKSEPAAVKDIKKKADKVEQNQVEPTEAKRKIGVPAKRPKEANNLPQVATVKSNPETESQDQSTETAAKKRGRPPKKTRTFGSVSNLSSSAASEEPKAKRSRGRPRKEASATAV